MPPARAPPEEYQFVSSSFPDLGLPSFESLWFPREGLSGVRPKKIVMPGTRAVPAPGVLPLRTASCAEWTKAHEHWIKRIPAGLSPSHFHICVEKFGLRIFPAIAQLLSSSTGPAPRQVQNGEPRMNTAPFAFLPAFLRGISTYLLKSSAPRQATQLHASTGLG